MLHVMCAQVEEAAASSQRQLAGHIEELQRQLEGTAHEVDEWRLQASEAGEQLQRLEQELPELSSRAARAEVGQMCLLSIFGRPAPVGTLASQEFSGAGASAPGV